MHTRHDISDDPHDIWHRLERFLKLDSDLRVKDTRVDNGTRVESQEVKIGSCDVTARDVVPPIVPPLVTPNQEELKCFESGLHFGLSFVGLVNRVKCTWSAFAICLGVEVPIYLVFVGLSHRSETELGAEVPHNRH